MDVVAIVAIALFTWSIVAFIPAVLARSKGRSFAAWWGLGLIIGIFAVVPAALIVTQRCPSCREVVAPGATVCPHCRSEIPQRAGVLVQPGQPEPGVFVALVAFTVVVVGWTSAFIAQTAALPVAGTVALIFCLVALSSGTMAVAGQIILGRR